MLLCGRDSDRIQGDGLPVVNIAFLQFGALGDCLMSTIALREIRERHPYDQITWMIFDQYREVAVHCPLIDDYIAWPLDPKRTRRDQERERWAEMKDYAAAKFDQCYIPQLFPDHRYEDKMHVHLIQQMCDYAGVPYRRGSRIAFNPGQWDMDRLLSKVQWSENYAWHGMSILPVSTQSITQPAVWNLEKYEELAEKLSKQGILCVFGDKTIGDWPRFDGTLGEWHSLVEFSFCYVGLDSGSSWLAASTDTPQIVMYPDRPTVPRWLVSIKDASIKPSELVHELTTPSVDKVVEAVVAKADSSTCVAGDSEYEVAASMTE